MNETGVNQLVKDIEKYEDQKSALRSALGLEPVPGTELTERELESARSARSWFTILSIVVSLLVLSAGNFFASALTTQAGYYLFLFSVCQGILHLRDLYGSSEYYTETEILRGNVAVSIRFMADVLLLVGLIAIAASTVSVTFSSSSTDYNGGDGIERITEPADSAAHTLGALSPWHHREWDESRKVHRLVEQGGDRNDRAALVRNAPLVVQSQRKGTRAQSMVRARADIQRAKNISQNRQRHARHHRA